MRTRNFISILAIHPLFPVIISIWCLALAICNGILVSAVNELVAVDFPGHGTLEQEPALQTFLSRLAFAKPWPGLGLGIIIGLLAFYMEKRKMRAAVANPENVERLVEWYLLPMPQRKERRRECWKPFRYPLKWCLFGLPVAAVLGYIFRFSLRTCFPALLTPWVILYPEYRRLYDGILARLTDAEFVGSQTAKKWQVIRKKAGIAVIVVALVLGCSYTFLAYGVLRTASDVNDTAETLTAAVEEIRQFQEKNAR